MKTQVKVVAHPETGAVITINANKPEFGNIRVDQTIVSMENGFLNKSNRTAFIAGKIEDLKALDLKAGSTLDGKIIRKESFEPMYEGQSAKINPSTDEEVLVDGKNVYFKDSFTADLSTQDSLVKAGAVVAVAETAGLAD